MARKPRSSSPSGVYHFMNRGVNKMILFHGKPDYEFYLALLKEYCEKLDIQIFHYCFMPNHIHLALRTQSVETLSQFGHFTHRRYAYYYCKTHCWSEQVFKRNFKSVPISDDAHLLECGRYIERNPQEAALVKNPEDYPYSSYPFYALGKEDGLITESPLYAGFGHDSAARQNAYRQYVKQERREIKQLTVPL